MKEPQMRIAYARKRTAALFLVLVSMMIGLSSGTALAETASRANPDYFVLKGGLYYPSERFQVEDFNNANRTSLSRRKGLDVEISWGHYFVPFFGMEFGVGYFESRQFADVPAGRVRLEALPVLLSAKFSLPLGPIEPYGEIGIGAYFWKSEIEGIFGRFVINREADVGPHAGVGVNLNLTDTFFIGVEGRYRRVKPDTGQNIKLNGYTATLNVGFRY